MLPKIVAVLRFIRAPLVVTVWSHLFAGGLITLWYPWPLWIGFTCVYLFGMAHNDWVDRERDKKMNPFRPLPSNALTENTARLILAMLAFGVAFSFLYVETNCDLEMHKWHEIFSTCPLICDMIKFSIPFSFLCTIGYNLFKDRFPRGSSLLLGSARSAVWFPFAVGYCVPMKFSTVSATWYPMLIVGSVGTLITLWSTYEDFHPSRKIWTLRFLLALPILDAFLVYYFHEDGISARDEMYVPEASIWLGLFPVLSLVGYLGVRALRKA